MERRFVFMVTETDDEYLEGSDFEVRAKTIAEACDIGKQRAERFAYTVTLIGERFGLGSTRRLMPFVPVDELPEHVTRNERVVMRLEVA